jgi:protein TonB
MKTIERKKKAKKGGLHVDHLLVEDPGHHHLLVKKKIATNSETVGKLIALKESNDKKNAVKGVFTSSISLCLSLAFCILMFEWRIPEEGAKVDMNGINQEFEDLVEIPQTEQIQKPPVQVQAPQIVEVADEEIIEEIEINLDIEMTEDTRIEDVVYDQSDEAMPEENVDEIFTIVEEQPAPVGGMKAFYEYVGKNLKYPPRAARMGIEGRVFVEFVVEKDGSLSDIKVARGIGGGCDEEAVRVISEAPKWQPGKQRGNAVRVRMIMPIVFKLVAT